MGRPKKPIDAEEVYKLARLGCTNQEIGDWFGVSDETIRTRFMDDLAVARADQKISLRKRQWNQSKSSVTMSIHLGKFMLGQKDVAGNPDELRNILLKLAGLSGDPAEGPGEVQE